MSLMDDLNSGEKKDTTEKKDTPSSPKEDGTTKVPTSLLETLQQQLDEQAKEIKNLKASSKGEDVDEDDIDPVEKDIVRFREFEKDRLVIGYNKERGIWKKYDKERREDVLMIELLVRDKKGDTTKEEVSSNDFFEDAKEVKIPVIRRENEKIVDKVGNTTIKTVASGDYKTIDTGKRTPLKVTRIESKALVEMPDGEQLLIDIDFINM